MGEIFSFLTLSVTLGISGAIQPGPLTALIVSQTLRYGAKEGIKVAFAPLITDIPIIILVTFILSKISQSNTILGIISLLGSGYLIHLAYESFRVRILKISEDIEAKSLRKGIITNFLNPAPYLFWLTIGAAMIQRALQIGSWMVIIYLVVSYSAFIGTYGVIAFFVGKFRNTLQSKIYILIVKGMGVALAIFAVLFLIRGLKLLELIR